MRRILPTTATDPGPRGCAWFVRCRLGPVVRDPADNERAMGRSAVACPAMPALVALTVHDQPEAWRTAGFAVDADGTCRVGAVELRLVAPAPDQRPGVAGWAFHGLEDAGGEIDGIATTAGTVPSGPAPVHDIGVTSLDHVVVLTPDLGRTVAALEARGLVALRERPTDAGGRPMRQVFLRPGEAIIEVVGPPEPTGGAPARFFGLAFTVADLDHAAELLGDRLGRRKDAVQPGRHIATLRSSAGLGVPVALMSPEPG